MPRAGHSGLLPFLPPAQWSRAQRGNERAAGGKSCEWPVVGEASAPHTRSSSPLPWTWRRRLLPELLHPTRVATVSQELPVWWCGQEHFHRALLSKSCSYGKRREALRGLPGKMEVDPET